MINLSYKHSQQTIASNLMITVKFEIKQSQLGSYFFNLLIYYYHFSGYKTLAAVGRDLIQAGIRSKDKAGLIHEKIKEGADERGLTEDEYKKVILAEYGIVNDYSKIFRKHGCNTLDELMKKLG